MREKNERSQDLAELRRHSRSSCTDQEASRAGQGDHGQSQTMCMIARGGNSLFLKKKKKESGGTTWGD